MKKLKKPQNLNINFEIIFKGLFFSLIFTWIFFNFFYSSENYSNFFAIILAIAPLLGAVYAFYRAGEWGLHKSFMGLSLISLGFALFMFFVGQSFYFLDSISENQLEIYDFFFILIDPLYLLGIYFIAKTIGTFKYFHSNFSLVLLPLFLFILNYFIVAFLTNGDVLNLIFEFDTNSIFIFGSILLATFIISVLIFSKKLGGIYKTALHFIFYGILAQFLGDNLYNFLEGQQLNGSLADLLFFVSIAFVTFGIYKLDPEKLND